MSAVLPPVALLVSGLQLAGHFRTEPRPHSLFCWSHRAKVLEAAGCRRHSSGKDYVLTLWLHVYELNCAPHQALC